MTAESREIAAIVDAFPEDIRRKMRDAALRLAEVYAAGLPPVPANPLRRGRPAYPSPCCGRASRAIAISDDATDEVSWRCSGCGRLWTSKQGRPALHLVPALDTPASGPEAG